MLRRAVWNCSCGTGGIVENFHGLREGTESLIQLLSHPFLLRLQVFLCISYRGFFLTKLMKLPGWRCSGLHFFPFPSTSLSLETVSWEKKRWKLLDHGLLWGVTFTLYGTNRKYSTSTGCAGVNLSGSGLLHFFWAAASADSSWLLPPPPLHFSSLLGIGDNKVECFVLLIIRLHLLWDSALCTSLPVIYETVKESGVLH